MAEDERTVDECPVWPDDRDVVDDRRMKPALASMEQDAVPTTTQVAVCRDVKVAGRYGLEAEQKQRRGVTDDGVVGEHKPCGCDANGQGERDIMGNPHAAVKLPESSAAAQPLAGQPEQLRFGSREGSAAKLGRNGSGCGHASTLTAQARPQHPRIPPLWMASG
jgi:hypothetical protein